MQRDNLKKVSAYFLFYCLALLSWLTSDAQPYIGLRADVGNRLTYSPESRGFERPLAISGSILFNFQQRVHDNWTLQYEGHLGVLGYKMRVISLDTLALPEPYPFPEYSTFYGGVSLVVFRAVRTRSKEVMIGLGGGASYYYSFFPVTSYGISIIHNAAEDRVFHAEITSPTNSVVPFATIASQLRLTQLFSIQINYSHYFKDVLSGSFEFHHTRNPTRGEVSLRQRQLGLAVLLKIR